MRALSPTRLLVVFLVAFLLVGCASGRRRHRRRVVESTAGEQGIAKLQSKLDELDQEMDAGDFGDAEEILDELEELYPLGNNNDCPAVF